MQLFKLGLVVLSMGGTTYVLYRWRDMQPVGRIAMVSLFAMFFIGALPGFVDGMALLRSLMLSNDECDAARHAGPVLFLLVLVTPLSAIAVLMFVSFLYALTSSDVIVNWFTITTFVILSIAGSLGIVVALLGNEALRTLECVF